MYSHQHHLQHHFSFHLQNWGNKSEDYITTNVPLPPVNGKFTIVDLQLNFMVTTVEYTEYLNTFQVTVGVIDQPLYTIKKTIQLKHANKFNRFFCFMGSL